MLSIEYSQWFGASVLAPRSSVIFIMIFWCCHFRHH